MNILKKVAELLRAIRPQTITHNVKPTDYKWILDNENKVWKPVKSE